VTKVELLRGRIDYLLKAEHGEAVLRVQALLWETEQLLNRIEIIPFDSDAIAQFDILALNPFLRKSGRADLLIASIALSRHVTLITRNLKDDFQHIPNLQIVNWLD
jgi:tRNA(fMet)-specific endonuclease VapC